MSELHRNKRSHCSAGRLIQRDRKDIPSRKLCSKHLISKQHNEQQGSFLMIKRKTKYLPMIAVSIARRAGSMWAGRWRSAPTGPPSRWSARAGRSRWTLAPVTGIGTDLSTTLGESSVFTRTWGGQLSGVVWCGVVWCGVVWCGVIITWLAMLPGENTPSLTMGQSWSVFTVGSEPPGELLTVLIELSASHSTWSPLCPSLPHW